MDLIFAPLANFCILLAADPAPNAPGGLEGLFKGPFPLIIMLVLLGYFMLFRPERQKQATMKAMLANLKKSDRVVTAGGIKGIVSNVHREADEVTVTVDESTPAPSSA